MKLDSQEIKILIVISIIVTIIFTNSNQKSTGIYDELLSNGIPHHELIESGYPFVAYTYWTRCTTGGITPLNFNYYAIFLDTLFSFLIVFSPYYLGKQIDRVYPRVGEQQK